MIFYVYSKLNKDTITYNLGEPEYSYYFVLQEYLPTLQKLGEVVHITDPAAEVDLLFIDALERGIPGYFLSFTPPHLTQTGLKCPTVPIFAWEFDSIPNETWWQDQPQNDWRYNLRKFSAAIVHSQFTAESVRKEMPPGFPVLSIPAPVWDRLAPLRQVAMQKQEQTNIHIDSGIVFDTHNPDFKHWLPSEEDVIAHVTQPPRNTQEQGNQYLRNNQSAQTITKEFVARWSTQVLSRCVPKSIAKRIKQRAAKYTPWDKGQHLLTLNGIVFTSVLNPYDGRKNWTDILNAFCTAFKDNEHATLVLKLGHHKYHVAISDMLMTMAFFPSFKCRVILLHGHLSSSNYTKLIQATDFIVNASHGEGQCLPLMEYLSCGKPAIAPRNSAMLDYMDEKIGFVVNSFEDYTTWPHDPRVAYRTCRHQIDWSSLVQAYENAYACITQEPERYNQMSSAAITRMQNHCSQAVALDKIRSILGMHNSPLPMHHNERDLVRRPSADEWVRISRSPDFVDARDCGLVDAVQSGWYQNNTNELFKGFQVSAEDTVVDIGCGAGGATLFCANRGAAVTYVDVDPQTIAVLSSKLIDTPARFSQGIVSNCSPLPLPDAYASRIIAMEVIEHVESPIETLKELVRIGKPGALYLIAVPDKIGEDIQKNIAPNAYFEHPNHIHIFSRNKFSSLIKESGLDVLQHDYYGFFWTMWMLIYWVSNKASNDTNQEIAHDTVQPPYYPLLNNWASLWYQFNKISEANVIKKQLDELMPKSQIIVAQKPFHHEK